MDILSSLKNRSPHMRGNKIHEGRCDHGLSTLWNKDAGRDMPGMWVPTDQGRKTEEREEVS